jgi:trigger factor
MGKTEDEFKAEMVADSEARLRQSIILGKIARERELEVSGELMTAEVVRQAQQRGVPQDQFQKFVDELRTNGGLQQIAASLRQQLALEEVVKEASITDASGTELTEEDLFPGRKAAEADADAEAEDAEEEKAEA